MESSHLVFTLKGKLALKISTDLKTNCFNVDGTVGQISRKRNRKSFGGNISS